MAHMNDGSTPGDSVYEFLVDPSLYPQQFSQHPQNPQQYPNGDLLYDSTRINFSAMLRSDDATLDDLHSVQQDGKTAPSGFYSLSDASGAYQAQSYCLPSPASESFDFQTQSYNIPRTIGTIFTQLSSEESLSNPVDENPRFIIQPPTFSLDIQVGNHEASDYRSTPSASPATPSSGFEGLDSGATHSSVNSAAGLGSARSSARASPFSTHEDSWQPSVGGIAGEMEAQDFHWDSDFINPLDLTNATSQTPIEEPTSPVNSPYLPAASPRLASNPPSPSAPRKRLSGRLSPFTGGRSHPTFPYPPPRRDSIKSNGSSRGSKSPRLESSDESSRMRSPTSPTGAQPNNGRDSVCPECGKTFRDMRAHLLTHKLERPEKCPIATCEYSKKGFARKYDCQRHTLTHYKGTMVCGFCPCAGSPAEKSFNRADVFKRHLMSVHNVEQQPPNGRKKTTATTTSQAQQSPSSARAPENFGEFEGTGKCSTCSVTFSTAQQFYEHLDDCVLSKVVQEEPGAAYNEINLSQIKLEDIADSLVNNNWRGRRSKQAETEDKPEEEDEDEDEDLGDADETEDHEDKDGTFNPGKGIKQNKVSGMGRTPNTRSGAAATKIKRGVRYRVSKITSRDGAVRPRARRGGKKRKNFPASWGCSSEQMVTKRRCLVVYKGPSVLLRDEMMMNTEFEVKASMGGENYVSDLDFWTLQRANAALEAAPSNLEVR